VSPELRQECIEVVEALVSVIEGDWTWAEQLRALRRADRLLAELQR
jgi:hypothetical protein